MPGCKQASDCMGPSYRGGDLKCSPFWSPMAGEKTRTMAFLQVGVQKVL